MLSQATKVISANYISNISILTKREQECGYYLTRGFSMKEIANALNISPRTVECYIINIKQKLNCYKRSDIVQKIMEGAIN
jgi:DNA-binding NarL/FixJ family response regulator